MCNYGIKRCYLIRNNYANTSLKKLDDRVRDFQKSIRLQIKD